MKITVEISNELWNKLKLIAKIKDESINEIITSALKNELINEIQAIDEFKNNIKPNSSTNVRKSNIERVMDTIKKLGDEMDGEVPLTEINDKFPELTENDINRIIDRLKSIGIVYSITEGYINVVWVWIIILQ